MNRLLDHPRFVALLWILGGITLMITIIAISGLGSGGRTGSKAALLLGGGGIAAGVGVTQVVWPPRRAKPEDPRSGWARAHWLQKALWVVGGIIGLTAAAVLATVMGGKY